MREKLIELLNQVQYYAISPWKHGMQAIGNDVVADFLIAHGVTIQTEAENPKTNGDRIRAMTDEELFEWAMKQVGCGFDFFPCGVVCDGKCESYDTETCKAKILEWLKQPAED